MPASPDPGQSFQPTLSDQPQRFLLALLSHCCPKSEHTQVSRWAWRSPSASASERQAAFMGVRED